MYWFHGTDHNSALNIAQRGIDVTKGKPNQDFSKNGGFYLSTRFETASDWSQMIRKRNRSVIVFRIEEPDEVFGDVKIPDGEDFPTTNDDWKNLVKWYRGDERNNRFTKQDKKLSYIYGPVSKCRESSAKRWNPIRMEDDRGKLMFQLCIKNQDLADNFYINIAQVIFFK